MCKLEIKSHMAQNNSIVCNVKIIFEQYFFYLQTNKD